MMTRAEFSRRLGIVPAWTRGTVAVVRESEPSRFIAAFAEAAATAETVFLADPHWGQREQAQLAAWVQQQPVADERGGEHGWLCIPTGGSSGYLRLARHDQGTLEAAVRGFAAHFAVDCVQAVGVLPLYHVSGFMAWLRCRLTGGEYLPLDPRELVAEQPALPPDGAFLSLVPTQLQRMLAQPGQRDWLRRFRAIFIGGGPAWPELIEAGAAAGLPLAFSYGMTETAAMVTALRSEEFARGERGAGRALPHASVKVGSDGVISIQSAALFRGYWPAADATRPWRTQDLGRFDANGSLHVLGRQDALIISGGEKVDPTEVEAVLRSSGEFADVAVMGEADSIWGEAVVAYYPATAPAPRIEQVERVLAERLAKFKWPKRYLAVEPWPRSAQGKINRAGLRPSGASEGRGTDASAG